MEIIINGKRVPVATLAAARTEFNRYTRDLARDTGLGVSGLKRHDGKVFQGKRLIARVSYNGCVWDTAEKEIVVH